MASFLISSTLERVILSCILGKAPFSFSVFNNVSHSTAEEVFEVTGCLILKRWYTIVLFHDIYGLCI